MIIDTSALIAVLFREPEREEFLQLMLAADVCRLSVVSKVELTIVSDRQARPDMAKHASDLLRALSVVEEPVTLEQGRLAREAFLHFGRGRHRAKLNFGDCFAYALAKDLKEPLLFKGDDFSRTDIRSARP